jgi:hypothetical protein
MELWVKLKFKENLKLANGVKSRSTLSGSPLSARSITIKIDRTP